METSAQSLFWGRLGNIHLFSFIISETRYFCHPCAAIECLDNLKDPAVHLWRESCTLNANGTRCCDSSTKKMKIARPYPFFFVNFVTRNNKKSRREINPLNWKLQLIDVSVPDVLPDGGANSAHVHWLWSSAEKHVHGKFVLLFLMLVRLTTTVVASYLRRRRIQKKGRSMQFRSPRVILNGVISNLNPTSVLCAAFFSDSTYALSGLGAHVKSFATEIFPRPDARCEACKQLPAHSLHFVLSWGSRTYFLRQPIKRWHFCKNKARINSCETQVPRASMQRWECGICSACMIPFGQINRTKKQKETKNRGRFGNDFAIRV